MVSKLRTDSTAVAATLEQRSFIAIEIDEEYVSLTRRRLDQAIEGTLKHRDDSPPLHPDPAWKVARAPEHFKAPTSDCV